LNSTPENALDYLRSTGRIPPGPASVAALGWGVSNVVLRVETAGGRFILKQSRPQIATRDLWLRRYRPRYREQEVMEVLGPLLPEGIVPRVLFVDRPNYLFAMTHAPLEAHVWKEILLDGEIDLALGELTGRVLGRMHQATKRATLTHRTVRNRNVFIQLRVDPFIARSGALVPTWPLRRAADRRLADEARGDLSWRLQSEEHPCSLRRVHPGRLRDCPSSATAMDLGSS